MKLTNAEVYNAWEPLRKLGAEKLPWKVSYDLAILQHKLAPQYNVIEGVRNSLVQKYGKAKDGKPNELEVDRDTDPEAWVKFMQDWFQVLGEEVEIEFKPVKLPEMVDGETKLAIEPQTLVPLIEKFLEV